MGLTLKTFAKHLTSEGFSMFPVVYLAKVSELAVWYGLGLGLGVGLRG